LRWTGPGACPRWYKLGCSWHKSSTCASQKGEARSGEVYVSLCVSAEHGERGREVCAVKTYIWSDELRPGYSRMEEPLQNPRFGDGDGAGDGDGDSIPVLTEMDVCMCAGLYVCMHACMYVCMHVWMCVYACVGMCVCMCACMYVCMHVWVCVYACVGMCVCMCACMYVCVLFFFLKAFILSLVFFSIIISFH
jgi:hypothetical protein